ncbi:MAG: lytic murein transglycosylase B [Lysobacteraceae bacterium]
MPAKPLAFLLSLSLLLSATLGYAASPKRSAEAEAAFVDEVNGKYGVPKDVVRKGLAEARYQQSIIDAITRPAEGMPWSRYRPIFMNDKRIQGGRDFLAENRDSLLAVERDTGVPASIIVAIIGVETNYGTITGKYRVLDALYTLGFHYPKRAEFFRSELGHLFALADEEHVDPNSVMGSYAGAMGWGQFMPSSYRAYAKDGDGDGDRDLWTSKKDIFRSIANYFVAHKWRAGEPVAELAVREPGVAALNSGNKELKPELDLATLGERGYRPKEAMGRNWPANLINLEGDAGAEYWITFHNFYVISRYNRSPLYSLAVYQLAQAIAEGDSNRSGPASAQ